jgi:hypothetical protein
MTTQASTQSTVLPKTRRTRRSDGAAAGEVIIGVGDGVGVAGGAIVLLLCPDHLVLLYRSSGCRHAIIVSSGAPALRRCPPSARIAPVHFWPNAAGRDDGRRNRRGTDGKVLPRSGEWRFWYRTRGSVFNEITHFGCRPCTW